MSEVYQVRRNDGRINIDLPTPLLIVGDIKIEFQQKLKLDILNLSQRYKYEFLSLEVKSVVLAMLLSNQLAKKLLDTRTQLQKFLSCRAFFVGLKIEAS